MYSEKGTKIVDLCGSCRTEKKLTNPCHPAQIARIGQIPSCLVLSLPPPHVHTLCFTNAGNIQHTPLQKYRVAGEDVHLVTMADKMQPALLVTAQPTKKARKKLQKKLPRKRLWMKKEVGLSQHQCGSAFGNPHRVLF